MDESVKSFFDLENLPARGKALHRQYLEGSPFPHIVMDHFMEDEWLEQALLEFPDVDHSEFYAYDNPLEKKFAYDQIFKLPPRIREILIQMNSPVFLCFLEELTGIQGLIPDPYYRGCGIHMVGRGGKLDIHLDFNKHRKLGLNRKLNVMLYLNKNWEEIFDGHLELWSSREIGGQRVLNQCEKKIAPLFNRFVAFACTERSFHGHPEPLKCPEGWSRKAVMAAYYVSPNREETQEKDHSTLYVRRPCDPVNAEIEKLREQRALRRLTSNVKNEFTA